MRVKYKSFNHFMSYNLGKIVFIVLSLLLVFYLFSQDKEQEPDFLITYVGKTYLLEQEQNIISNAVYQCIDDKNKTLKIEQYIIDYNPSDENMKNMQMYYTNAMKLMGELQLNSCLIYLFDDPEGFERSTDILQPDENGVLYKPLNLEGLEREIYIGKRKFYNPEIKESFKASYELFYKLL